MLAGILYLYCSAFPEAESIRYPELEKVVSVTLGCNTPDVSITMVEKYYEDLLLCISEAEPTRKQAMDDYPTSRPYYGVEIKTRENRYRYYVYEDGEQVYIEIPYEGIYTAEMELFDLVLKYFEEG